MAEFNFGDVPVLETTSGKLKGYFYNGEYIFNDYYKGNPLDYGLWEQAFEIPLMVGSVFGEFAFTPAEYDKDQLTKDQVRAVVSAVYGEHTDEMIELFQETYPGKNATDLLLVDRIMRQPSKQLAKLHAQEEKAGTYLYDFTLEFPIHHNKIAWHCSDIPFFFHNIDLVEVCQIPEVGERLESQMFEAFMTFVKTGKPTSDKLPVWEAITAGKEPTMIFDRKCEIRYNFDDKLYEKIDSILPPTNLTEILNSGENKIQH